MVRIDKLDRERVAETLIEALAFVANGNVPKEIGDEIKVLDEWELDSEQGVELACDLSGLLGIAIPENENPLIDESGQAGRKRARTFGEVVDYLVELSAAE